MSTRATAWERLVYFAVLAVVAGLGFTLIFGPNRFETSRSLTVVHTYTHLPWEVFGWMFLILAAGLCNWRTRPVAYGILGVVCTAFVLVTFFYTTLPGEASNIVVACLSLLSPLLLFAGGRYSITAYRARRVEQRRKR